MDYCMSAFRKSQKEETICYYIADGLYGLLNQSEQIQYNSRLVDLLHPVSEEEEEKQKEENKQEAKEIVSNLKKKLRGNDQ